MKKASVNLLHSRMSYAKILALANSFTNLFLKLQPQTLAAQEMAGQAA